MQLLAVPMARTLAFAELSEFNKSGNLYLPEIAKDLVAKCGFTKFPQDAKEFDLGEGIEFHNGRWADDVISRLTIFGGIVHVETQSSTLASQRILMNLFLWLRNEYGASFDEGTIRHWAYVNQIIFKTDFPLIEAVSGPVQRLAERTGAVISDLFKEEIVYKPQIVQVGHDPTSRKNGIAHFSIAHRGGIPYAENRYFSESPLPTATHWELLEQFAREVLEERTRLR